MTVVAPETAYWSHGLVVVVAELPISAEVAGLAVPAAEVVVDHYSVPARDFSVHSYCYSRPVAGVAEEVVVAVADTWVAVAVAAAEVGVVDTEQ